MNRLFQSFNQKLNQKFKQDILGLLLLATGLFLGLALLSFHPMDPSLNSIGKNLHVMNYCGYVGSFLADAFYQIFGLSAWLLVGGVLRLGALSLQSRVKGEALSFKNLRLIWLSVLLLSFASLLAIYMPTTRLFQDQILAGGIVGVGVSQALVRAFNLVGAQVVLWTAMAVLVIFYSEKTIQELMKLPMAWLASFRQAISEQLKARKKLISTKKIQKKEDVKAVRKVFEIKDEGKDEAPEENLKPRVQLTLSGMEDTHPIEESNEPAAEGAFEGPVKRRKVVLKTQVQRRIENWELPKINLLEDPPASRIRLDEKEIKRKADILKEKLAHFNVTGEVVAAKPGPAVTMFEFRPDANVKVSEVTALADDLSLALSSESLRILAPIPGRDVVGIETSNAHRETVYFKDMLADDDFWKEDMKLPVTLGKTATGEPKIMDLRRLPHLMVAGTTGSGKSVFTVSLIMGLLFKHSPKTLKLIIVDPKQVDYAAFEKIPHLALPVISDTRQAVTALKWAVNEMEKRYRSMSRFAARGLESYNEAVAKLSKEQIEEHDKKNQELDATPGKKGEKYYFQQLPYLVIILEEFGDLMTVDKQNVEHSVVRLAQKARASGIHLVLAMQSPRKEVVTGLIKTNIPGRIAFKVASGMDSRVILDETGAERLLAQGDMLFKSPGTSSLVRHHGSFLKDSEVIDIAKFWAAQSEPEFDATAMKAIEGHDEDASGEHGGGENPGDDSYDERYDEILSWASSQKSISASLIQRKFSIGYPRAARLVETFEREGVVGPANGSKPRQVLINSLASLEE
jgi:S-DNA-T family DNA segregation ATPase FtsK/SpoIIIE